MRYLLLLSVLLFSCKDENCFDCFIAELNNNQLITSEESFCGSEEEANDYALSLLETNNIGTQKFSICTEEECIPCAILVDFGDGQFGIAPRSFCGSKSEAREFEEETGAVCQL